MGARQPRENEALPISKLDAEPWILRPKTTNVVGSGRIVDGSERFFDGSGVRVEATARVVVGTARPVDPSGRAVVGTARLVDPSGRAVGATTVVSVAMEILPGPTTIRPDPTTIVSYTPPIVIVGTSVRP